MAMRAALCAGHPKTLPATLERRSSPLTAANGFSASGFALKKRRLYVRAVKALKGRVLRRGASAALDLEGMRAIFTRDKRDVPPGYRLFQPVSSLYYREKVKPKEEEKKSAVFIGTVE